MKKLYNTKKKICFISKSIHFLLLKQTKKRIGGAELQQIFLAESLAEMGYNVSIVTEKMKNLHKLVLKTNLNMHFLLNFTDGNKIVNKLIYLPISLFNALNLVDANIYYHRNPDYLSGIIALFCKLKKKRFFLAGANDWNFMKGKERNLNNILDRISARYAIKNASILIVQNRNQEKLLKKNYKRKGHLFYNMYPTRNIRKKGKHILWVSRTESYKRPEIFLEIARKLPKKRFLMVCGKGDDKILAKKIEEEAKRINNLEYLGHQTLNKVEALFNETSVFVNTSIPGCEGFPNTFLQSWSRGIPVISFFDPDDLISKNSLGTRVSDIDEMMINIIKHTEKNQNINNEEKRIKEYFDKNFELNRKIQLFSQILLIK